MTATVISGATVLDGQTIDIRAAKVATGLAAMGIGAGDAVAIFLRNDPVFFEISMGAALLGAKKNDLVTYAAPNGNLKVKIIGIQQQ